MVAMLIEPKGDDGQWHSEDEEDVWAAATTTEVQNRTAQPLKQGKRAKKQLS